MKLATKIVVGAINIAASPHEEGTYRRLIEAVAGKEVDLGGSDFAKLTKPEQVDSNPNVMIGRICVYALIDKKSDWFNKETNDKATEKDKESIVVADNLAPNYRYFYYALELKRHLIIFEMSNEMNQHFGAARASKFFNGLFSGLPDDFPMVSLTVIPEEGTVDRILALPKLNRLKIFITRPNPEDLNDEYAEVMKTLNEENASSVTQEITKAPKAERLTPNERTRKLAYVAASNGYVEGGSRGLPPDSTKSHAKRVEIKVGKDGSSILRFLSSFLNF
ncbi:DUF4747 family protein [Rhodoblastus sp.]|uniref:DUF4747 family protein n=1 Tax=Rhodoblastus sp. TaxID=1962975 RepID=UPI003F9B64BF